MDPRHKDFVQKILLEYLNNPQYLCYPETDDSDSDYEPDDCESSEDDYEDSEEDPETCCEGTHVRVPHLCEYQLASR